MVDDNAGVRTLLKEILEDEGHSVELFQDCEAYLDAHQPGRLGCILSDVMMPGMGGIAMLELLLGLGDQIPVVMMTVLAHVSMAVKAMKAGAFDFLEKPFRHADLLTIVDFGVGSCTLDCRKFRKPSFRGPPHGVPDRSAKSSA